MTDNGRPFPHAKTRLNVDGTRTPFIVRLPGVTKPGSLTDSVVSSIDIAPTLLDLAGVKKPATMQGVSFVPVLKDAGAQVRPLAFAEHNWHDYRAFERAAYDKQYVYIRNFLPELPGTPPADAVTSATHKKMLELREAGKLTPVQAEIYEAPRPAEFLYDVAADPECTTNLAGGAAHAEVQQRLRAALDQWQRDTGDVFPGADKLTPDQFDRLTGAKLMKQPQR
jgi:arylsulfatase A-like enzyme